MSDVSNSLTGSGRCRWILTRFSSGFSGALRKRRAPLTHNRRWRTFAPVACLALAAVAASTFLALRHTGHEAEAAQQILRRQFIRGIVAAPVQLSNAPADGEQIPVPVQFLPEDSSRVPGSPIALLRIPAIDVDVVVVEGAGPEELKKGPGLQEASALPGEDGLVTVAGNRLTHGAPFRKINRLRVGDPIWITTASGDYLYTVTSIRSGDLNDIEGPATQEADSLVLTTTGTSVSRDWKLLVTAAFKEHRPRHVARLVLPADNSAVLYQQEAANDFDLESLGSLAAKNVTPRRAPAREGSEQPEPVPPPAPQSPPPAETPIAVAAPDLPNPTETGAAPEAPAPTSSPVPSPVPSPETSPSYPAHLPPDPSAPACRNGIDDDGDGLIDYRSPDGTRQDKGCNGWNDTSE